MPMVTFSGHTIDAAVLLAYFRLWTIVIKWHIHHALQNTDQKTENIVETYLTNIQTRAL